MKTSFQIILQAYITTKRNQESIERKVLGYIISVLVIIATFAIKQYIENRLDIHVPLIMLIFPILVNTWFWSLKRGIPTLMIVLLWSSYLLIPYPFQGKLLPQATINTLVLFLIEAIIALIFAEKRRRIREHMSTTAIQQAVLAEIGRQALRGATTTALMHETVRLLAIIMPLQYSAVFDLVPEGNALRLRSGTGWKKGVVGNAIVEAGKNFHTGHVLSSQQPIHIRDTKHEKQFLSPSLFQEHGIISCVEVVIAGLQRPFGVLGIYNIKQRPYTNDDIQFLQTIAEILGVAIDRQRSLDTLTFLANTSATFTSSLDEQVTLSNVTRLAVPEIADWCMVALIKDSNEISTFDVAAAHKTHEKRLRDALAYYFTTSAAQEKLAKIVQVKSPRLINHIPHDWLNLITVDPKQKNLMMKFKPHSLIAVPLRTKKRYYGVIILVSSSMRERYTQTHLLMARELANRAAIAIENTQLFQESQAAIQARDEFLSIASHELKTPLTTMLLQLQSVMYNMKNQTLANFSIDRMMEMLESTEKQSKRLSRLINDLLNTSLISTGRIELEKEKTDIARLVQDVSTRFNAQLEQTHTTLTINAKNTINIDIDRLRMEQVITNLISNAIKYGKGKPIDIQVEKMQQSVRITVEDKGIGIPVDKQKLIFGRFERGVSTKEYRGLGVGLYIAKQIIISHGGTIGVKSMPNQGATFVIDLPFQTPVQSNI